ncbi:class I SAM-dependent methyltransferase [Thalassospira marina]|uniref:Methyltransferase type 11 n=1 Tax=Thalassospira marina TaxID=2048283 RepID=A0A2N3KW07_9PROT|nr:class I SAM-dependent methyltransferase [Thalassospira marina]PKR54759.1 methyltransferase type 11 [Thalassospira marina]
MTEDAIYQNRLLVALYDVLNPAGQDTEFYLLMAQDAQSVLDIGCGTGLLTAALAQQGKDITGIDPAAEMLSVARKRLFGDRVHWQQGTAESARLDQTFDLVIMTGHVFQVFLDDEAARATLAKAFALLKPGGRLIFESRNPLQKPWLNWTPDQTRKTVMLDDIGAVTVEHDLQWVKGDQVHFHTRHYFPGEDAPVTSQSTLRFSTRAEIEALLTGCGFAPIIWLGDWQGQPATNTGAELIAIATRPAS